MKQVKQVKQVKQMKQTPDEIRQIGLHPPGVNLSPAVILSAAACHPERSGLSS